MAKVKALYSYTYDYEGTKISFHCGDEFQLLAKVNADWWHVRRWADKGCAQDLYIPAVYVKEVGEDTDPLYQNMSELKKQVDEFKKKESSTPPPPTARKPRPERANSEKNKSNVTATVGPVVAKSVSSPEKKSAPEATESVADLAKRLAEKMQAKEPPDGEGGGGGVPRTGSTSPLVAQKRSQSTRRLESPSSPRRTRKLDGGGSANLLPAVASKPRSYSINTRPAHAERRKESLSPPELVLQHGEPPPAATKSGQVKSKLPPPVLPKAKLRRPNSMVMFSPTETGETAGGTEDPFVSVFQTQLSEQMKKVRSASGVGVVSGIGGGAIEAKTVAAGQEEGQNSTSHSAKPVQNGALPHDSTTTTTSTLSPTSPSPLSPPSSLPHLTRNTLPDGWTEHKTNEGHTYYYNSATGKSSWTRPPSAKKTTPTTSPTQQNGTPADPREKIAPRGWTKEINPLSQTPIYTNSRTGERWALAKDGTGNYHYYNMSNSLITVAELPDVADTPSSRSKQLPQIQQSIYDQLSPLTPSPSPNTTEIESAVEFSSNARAARPDPSTISPSHTHTQHPSTTGTTPAPATGGMLSAQLEVFHHSLANMQLKKHGYLQRKRLFDAQGKRGKGGWQKVYTSLDNFQLKFFTDHKIAMDPATKPLGTFHLLQANVCTYTKERKVKYSFMVSSPFGEQFLLQAETASLMNDWYSTIQTCVHKANEDYKLHPDKYADLHLDDGEISPKVLVGKQRRKGSKDIQPLSVAIDDDEELDNMELSDKSDRIRNRLRRLMARRPQMETLQKKGIIEDPVFGADLAKYCERKKVLVPQFLVQFMEHIEANGLDTVGLYRLSGNAACVQKLRCLVEQDSPFNLNDAEWADINIVTGCLKLYFRELPDPLIPASQFQKFIDAAKLAPTPAQRISGLAEQVKELPKINYCTLVALMKHLRKVMENGAVNMMRSQNVSIVFGPTLLRAEGDPFEMAKLTPFQNGIVEVMLTEFEKIFTRK